MAGKKGIFILEEAGYQGASRKRKGKAGDTEKKVAYDVWLRTKARLVEHRSEEKFSSAEVSGSLRQAHDRQRVCQCGYVVGPQERESFFRHDARKIFQQHSFRRRNSVLRRR